MARTGVWQIEGRRTALRLARIDLGESTRRSSVVLRVTVGEVGAGVARLDRLEHGHVLIDVAQQVLALLLEIDVGSYALFNIASRIT